VGWKIPPPMRTPTHFVFAGYLLGKARWRWVTSKLPTTDRIFPSAAAAWRYSHARFDQQNPVHFRAGNSGVIVGRQTIYFHPGD